MTSARRGEARHLRSFMEVRDDVATVHGQILALCGDSKGTCELACHLLGLCLSNRGYEPLLKVGAYETPSYGLHDHCWLEVDEFILDPTRDQFGADPLSETDGLYCDVEETQAPNADAATRLLTTFGRYGARDSAVHLAGEYGLSF